jgi:AcrR family transcriptional regulator
MELFWDRGYEGATLEDLLAAMGGISPPSFYHAFGSKEALFFAAVEYYLEKEAAPIMQALHGGRTARESIEAAMRQVVTSFSQPGKPRGCLLISAAVTCTPANKKAQEYLHGIRQRGPKEIQRRLDRAVAEGELSPELDTGAIAAFYATVQNGLGLRAADGASPSALLAAVDGAMAAWKTLTSTTVRSRPNGASTSARRAVPRPRAAAPAGPAAASGRRAR